jgi:hypothetical protein
MPFRESKRYVMIRKRKRAERGRYLCLFSRPALGPGSFTKKARAHVDVFARHWYAGVTAYMSKIYVAFRSGIDLLTQSILNSTDIPSTLQVHPPISHSQTPFHQTPFSLPQPPSQVFPPRPHQATSSPYPTTSTYHSSSSPPRSA